MARKKSAVEAKEADVDMTPMLDIVFILLIFFIVTTSFVREEGLLVNRPKKSTQSDNPQPVIVVQINENGQIKFNGKAVDIERLPARVENFIAKNDTNSAVIIPDEGSTYEYVVKVLDQLALFNQLTVSIGK